MYILNDFHMISLYVFQVESSEDLSEKVVTKFMYISDTSSVCQDSFCHPYYDLY